MLISDSNASVCPSRAGILSPPGSFLTPSPSPSVQSPRLQRSPSQSPFQQDVVLVSNSILNTTQDVIEKPVINCVERFLIAKMCFFDAFFRIGNR